MASAIASRAGSARASLGHALAVLAFLGTVLIARAFLFLGRDTLSLAKSLYPISKITLQWLEQNMKIREKWMNDPKLIHRVSLAKPHAREGFIKHKLPKRENFEISEDLKVPLFVDARPWSLKGWSLWLTLT